MARIGCPHKRKEEKTCAQCQARSFESALCGALELHELGPLQALTTELLAEPQHTVIHQDDPTRYLFIVKEGVVRLTKTLSDGRRQLTGFLFPGDFLGLGHSETYGYSAEAVSWLKLCRIELDHLLQLFATEPKLEQRMLAVASNEVARAQEQILLLGRKTARERMAKFLTQLAKECKKRNLPATPLELPMSRADIADYLGLTVETASRVLARLVNDGIIQLETPQRVVVLDHERLTRIAAAEE